MRSSWELTLARASTKLSPLENCMEGCTRYIPNTWEDSGAESITRLSAVRHGDLSTASDQ